MGAEGGNCTSKASVAGVQGHHLVLIIQEPHVILLSVGVGIDETLCMSIRCVVITIIATSKLPEGTTPGMCVIHGRLQAEAQVNA